jgi:hypothetical protein
MRKQLAAVLLAGVLGTACSGNDLVGNSTLMAGTYSATVFTVKPDDAAEINVLGAGGSLTITISKSGATTGSLHVPASVEGGPLTASMAGTASVTELTVEFDQEADTFVRDLTWSRAGTAIQVANYPLAGAVYTVTLQRQ